MKKIVVALGEPVFEELNVISKMKGLPRSEICRRLIEEALEGENAAAHA